MKDQVTVFFTPNEGAFIFAVYGKFSVDSLAEIEAQVNKCANELFTLEGEYTFGAAYSSGYWRLNEISRSLAPKES